MILDWKCPKYLNPLLTELQEMYWEDNKNTKEHRSTTNKALSCLINAMVKAVAFDTELVYIPLSKNVYSNSLIYNGTLVNRKVSYTGMKKVLDWMMNTGLISLNKGYIVNWGFNGTQLVPGDKKPTTLVISEYLKQKIRPYAVKKRLYTNPSVIEIRDKDGKPIQKKLDLYNQQMLLLYTKFNELARNADISVNGVSIDFQVRKIYNNSSFEQGGRVYGYNDPTIYSELLRRDNRGVIFLDKEITVELDYKFLHIALLCEKDGITLPEDFDPYQIELEGFSEKGARWIGKLASLIMINAGVVDKGLGGLIQAVKDDKKTKQYQATGDVPILKKYKYKKIFDAVLTKNPYLTKYAENPVGIYLQNKDSKIMDLVIGELNSIDEPAIPIHDSLVVKERLKEFTLEKMREAYKKVMGSGNNCRIEVNYASEDYKANAI